MNTPRFLLFLVAAASLVPVAADAASLRCARDAVAVGTVCVDKYEASAWRIPADRGALIARVKRGKATLEDLQGAGATQLCSVPVGNDTCSSCTFGPTFPDTGNWTEPVYAVSIPGVRPTSCITWFQAEQACRLSGKRLVTNQEWQAAAAGTPDPGAADDGSTTCNTNTDESSIAGARSACVSKWGTYDMVGNVWEWVGNWSDLATGTNCASWDATFGEDITCVGPNSPEATPTPEPAQAPSKGPRIMASKEADIFPLNPQFPGALIRGGNFAAGTRNGVFAIFAGAPPHNRSRSTGFRCVK